MTAALPPMQISLAAASDIGRVRELNEDAILVGDLESKRQWPAPELAQGATCHGMRGPLAVVCDGMGGGDGGEIASELAASVIWHTLVTTEGSDVVFVTARQLRRAMRAASASVHAQAKKLGARGMGTTGIAATIVEDTLVLANVGDSRGYVLRNGNLHIVTRDQSLAQALRQVGRSEAEAAVVGGAILQAIGIGPDVEPSLSLAQLCQGDLILLCSDGLHGLVSDLIIARALQTATSEAHAVAQLIHAAKVAGGTDNISVVVLRIAGARFGDAKHAAPLVFREFDPQKDGEAAVTSTSFVQRRLAARAGVQTDPGPRPLPPTGQHRAVSGPTTRSIPTVRPPSRVVPWLIALMFAAGIVLGLYLAMTAGN